MNRTAAMLRYAESFLCVPAYMNVMAQCRRRHRVSGFVLLFQPLADQESRREVDLARVHGVHSQDKTDIPRRAGTVLQ